jgi:hypothetical protein
MSNFVDVEMQCYRLRTRLYRGVRCVSCVKQGIYPGLEPEAVVHDQICSGDIAEITGSWLKIMRVAPGRNYPINLQAIASYLFGKKLKRIDRGDNPYSTGVSTGSAGVRLVSTARSCDNCKSYRRQ